MKYTQMHYSLQHLLVLHLLLPGKHLKCLEGNSFSLGSNLGLNTVTNH